MPRFQTLLLVLIVAHALPLCAQTPTAPTYEQLFNRALELQQAGDTLGAIDTYKAALALSPDRPDALTNLGAAYVRLGQFDDAIRQYEAALKADSASVAARLNLALAYYKSARPNQAIPHLRQVVATEPEARNAYLVLADCYLQTGQDTEVVALLKPRERMFESDLAYAYILGTALLRANNTTEGQTYIDRIFGAGETAEAHLLMGIAHLSRQDYPAAKTELARAVQLNPKLPTAHGLYGRSMLAQGDQEGAERAFREELQLNINDYEANLQLGYMRKSAQKLDDASAYLQRALTIRPNDLTARKLLASLRLQQGKVEESALMFEAIVKEAPDSIDAHVQLATAYSRLKRKEDADREKVIIDRLNAEAQAKQRGGKD
ncbi:MAG TPA: tetratricopeptide repeat protein [Vicinamibacterales bacterium]|jgi:tetratricopeptide (TPR) repeat protein|nr:tetratricopeptide repeat protein [Vicinamibacterales bacterium]